MIEYALLVALVALIAVPSIKMLGNEVNKSFATATIEVAGEGAITNTGCSAQNPASGWPDC